MFGYPVFKWVTVIWQWWGQGGGTPIVAPEISTRRQALLCVIKRVSVQGWFITSHSILRDVITYPCTRDLPSYLWYKTHLSRQLNSWSLRCSWSIACRRCSNNICILDPASMNWAKTTARRDKNHLSLWIWWAFIRDFMVLGVPKFLCVNVVSHWRHGQQGSSCPKCPTARGK